MLNELEKVGRGDIFIVLQEFLEFRVQMWLNM